ncbi:MAG: hypothetical protein ACLQAT_06890 [Candidatus Binataceae bacterium]
MAEADELKLAQALVGAGRKKEAFPHLEKLYASKDPKIKLYAGLALLVALDRLTQLDTLLQVVDETLPTATALGEGDIRAYLLSKRAEFLANKLSFVHYQQRNLTLAAGVFAWIGFSLDEDKAEFDRLAAERATLEETIASLEAETKLAVESSSNQNMRGHIFASLGELAFSRHLGLQLDLAAFGRMRSRLMNIYWVRRLNLEKLIGYNRSNRRKLKTLMDECVSYYERAIAEFEAEGRKGEQAFAMYMLAVKFTMTYRFLSAKRYLKAAKSLALDREEKPLIEAIEELEKDVRDKYRHPRNWMQEFGMDLPRSVRGKFPGI